MFSSNALSNERRCPNCGVTEVNWTYRCRSCHMLSGLTILFTGPALCLKSTTAKYLGERLNVKVEPAALMGATKHNGRTDEALRDQRRHRLLQHTLLIAKDGRAVIVDAAFHRQRDRLKFVRDLKSNGFQNDLFVLCCYSRDPAKRKERLRRRNEAILRRDRLEYGYDIADALEVEFKTWKEAQESLRQYRKPSKREPYPILFFYPDTRRTEILNASNASERLKSFLMELKKALEVAARYLRYE
jgi:predicted kinase